MPELKLLTALLRRKRAQIIMSNRIIVDTDGSRVIGMPGDEFQQSYADTCAIKSQQIILNEYGIPVTEDQCIKYSYDHGWYNGNGTSPEDIGKLLADGGIENHQQYNANVFDIMNELAQGHKIIVGVDSGELWGDSFVGWLRDFFLGDTPDHALIVSGIDTTDPNNIFVYVTDPGNGDHNKAYPLDQFMDAWRDAQCFMVATNDPVPASSPSMINFDYEIGHIPDVAGINFIDFQIFNDLSNAIPTFYFNDDNTFISPMSSLVSAYLDVSSGSIPFDQIFTDYEFNDYLDTDLTNRLMLDTYKDGLTHIQFTGDLNLPADDYFSGMISNEMYTDFLNDSMSVFDNVGDSDSSLYCQQQLHILDYCNSHDINFYDTFYNV